MNTKKYVEAGKNMKNKISDSKDKIVLKPPSLNITTNSNHRSSQIMHEGNKGNINTDPQEDDNEEYAISKLMHAVRMLMNETDLRQRITFVDFAGSLYYAFHQIFLSPKSCPILVVDMTKPLDETVDDSYTDEKCCSLFKSWTYRGNYSNRQVSFKICGSLI